MSKQIKALLFPFGCLLAAVTVAVASTAANAAIILQADQLNTRWSLSNQAGNVSVSYEETRRNSIVATAGDATAQTTIEGGPSVAAWTMRSFGSVGTNGGTGALFLFSELDVLATFTNTSANESASFTSVLFCCWYGSGFDGRFLFPVQLDDPTTEFASVNVSWDIFSLGGQPFTSYNHTFLAGQAYRDFGSDAGGYISGGDLGPGESTTRRYRVSTTFKAVKVPEPGTLALLGIGLAGLGLVRRKRAV